jgi:hypothetical protein
MGLAFDEKKVADLDINPAINRILNEVLPAFDKLLQSKIDQLKELKVSIQFVEKV